MLYNNCSIFKLKKYIWITWKRNLIPESKLIWNCTGDNKISFIALHIQWIIHPTTSGTAALPWLRVASPSSKRPGTVVSLRNASHVMNESAKLLFSLDYFIDIYTKICTLCYSLYDLKLKI